VLNAISLSIANEALTQLNSLNVGKYNSMRVGNFPFVPIAVEYLVIAGGAGGQTNSQGGGAGAGGYRSSVIGELSGANSAAESLFTPALGTNYSVTIGAGGAASSSGVASSFDAISTVGGGRGGVQGGAGVSGGSGGGGGGGSSSFQSGGAGTANQGFAGGHNVTSGTFYGGGGGGAGGSGGNGNGVRGLGLASSITGTSITRAAGGSGFGIFDQITILPNTGSGGDIGVSPTPATTRVLGSSGVVILRYPALYTITIGAGLSGVTTLVGNSKVTQILQGTGNVSWAAV